MTVTRLKSMGVLISIPKFWHKEVQKMLLNFFHQDNFMTKIEIKQEK